MKKHFLVLSCAAVMLIAVFPTTIILAMHYSQASTAFTGSTQLVPELNDLPSEQEFAMPTNTPIPQVTYPLIQKVNGVKMELLGKAIEGEYFTADICYDFPTNDPEWMLGGMSPEYITISNGQETIHVYSMGIIDDIKTDLHGNYTGRCDHLKFPILPSTNLDNLRITISRLATTPSEVMDCQEAQKKLDDANQNIKIKCTQGTGLGGFVVTSKPEGMDDRTANIIASDAFLDIVEGPWIFDLNDK